MIRLRGLSGPVRNRWVAVETRCPLITFSKRQFSHTYPVSDASKGSAPGPSSAAGSARPTAQTSATAPGPQIITRSAISSKKKKKKSKTASSKQGAPSKDGVTPTKPALEGNAQGTNSKALKEGFCSAQDNPSASSISTKPWTEFFTPLSSAKVPENKQKESDLQSEAGLAQVTEDKEVLVTPKKKKAVATTKSSTKKKGGSKKSKASGAAGTSPKKPKQGPDESDEPGQRLVVNVIRPQGLLMRPVEENQRAEVPGLSYSLDRVLFNQGVYQIQDERSGVFNFDPYLASIMPIKEFDFDALKEYITSSKDVKLRELCAKHKRKYCGSTSSMTAILSQFHFLLSAWRQIYLGNLSQSLRPDSLNYTNITRAPAAAYARLQDGVYAIDADKSYDTESVLSQLGKSMEKLLTLPKEEFEKYRKTKSHEIPDEEKNGSEAYHYTTLGDFLMRSQLDAHDPRLPGTGMFDLKTRAVISIRMDVQGYEKGVDYEIRFRTGQWESFEREYFDMIRSAFLKYSLQVRMGRMDGIFVAFHNTRRIFGFQYISLEEMDQAIHGTTDLRLGDQEFKCSIAMLNDLMNRATKRFPGRTLQLHVETRPTKVPLTYFFVEPMTEEEVERNQAASKPLVEKLEREVRQSVEMEEAEGAADEDVTQSDDPDAHADSDATEAPQTDAAWEELMRKVEETVKNESLGVVSLRGAIQGALEQSGLLRGLTEVESDKALDEMVSVLTAHMLEGKEQGQEEDDVEESDVSENEPDLVNEETESGGASLTDLIIKVTQTLDDEKQSLKAFQRAFVDLATQSTRMEDRTDKNTDGLASEECSDEADAAATEQPAAATSPAVSVGEEGLEQADAVQDGAQAEAVADADASGGRAGRKPAIVDIPPDREIMGLYVTIRNTVNGKIVDRPGQPGPQFDWSVQYAITELPRHRAVNIYTEMKKRRKKALENDPPEEKAAEWHRMFGGRLPRQAKKGAQFRLKKTKREAGKPVLVAWDKKPLAPAKATKGASAKSAKPSYSINGEGL